MNSGKETKTMSFGLERMRKALVGEGFKQDFRCVLIAGSTGKSQTAVFTESLLMRSGFSVGTYLSPHLERIGERVRLNGREISDSLYYSRMRRFQKYPLTYFEKLTAAAFMYFMEKKPQWAVVEVGLGGRLDATNVLKNEIAVITGICREHTEYLGPSVEEIAREKAGIIKKGSLVITRCGGAAADVIKTIAARRKASVINAAMMKTPYGPAFLGENYSLAASAVKSAGIEFDKGYFPEYILPSRFERKKYKGIDVILDGGHTLDAWRAVKSEIKKTPRPRVCVFYALKDKKIEEMLSSSNGLFEKIFCSSFPHERKIGRDELMKRARGTGVEISSSPVESLKKAAALSPEVILCFGSLIGSAYLRKKIWG
ncbi:MAG: hypothetical protein CVU78_05410 [Elusimicrobia bacterium HGW-Elusimicrobia-2]|nr:MAG: hypothetical protein CVU78_05410 [Elusimicrobia bacterium HGW-Elusimicrobia-2]